MATRILGPTGSKRRRRFLFVPILLVACAALFYIAGAQAVHDTGKFQLDGDASHLTDPATPSATDDWDMVCHQYANPLPTGGCGTTSNTTGSTSGSWASDGSLSASIFTGGGSKDPIDISSWNWKDGSVPDKDNLLHAFAARYSLPPDPVDDPSLPPDPNNPNANGTACLTGGLFPTCDVIYFGIDRYDNSGDAQNGFWFLKSNVQTVSGRPAGTFSGVHQNGDILVVSDFSIGGTTSTITVYKWDSACTATNKPDASCADSNLRQLETSTNAKCSGAATGDSFCGITNPTDGTLAPWAGDYTDKSGNHTYLNGEFYEAGLNLSTLGLAGECFSSMVAESRASTSTSAVLKDFVVAHFPQCKPSLATAASQAGNTITPGTAVHDTATITVSGGTNAPDPTGTVTFFLCGPSTTGNPTCTSDGNTFTNNTGLLGDSNRDGIVDDTTPNDGIASAVSGDVNTSDHKLTPGYYCFRATWPGDTNYPPPASGTFTNPDNTGECFRVQDTSSMTSAQNWLPNDSATITSANGTALNGTVDITLYDGTINCADPTVGGTVTPTVLYTEPTITLANATSPDTEHTNNTATKITIANNRTVTWRVVFASTDSGVASPSGPKCETTNLTITNN